MLCIVYFEVLLYSVLHCVGNLCWYYCYSQNIISAIAKQSLIFPLILQKLQKERKNHKLFNTVIPNSTANQINQMGNIAQFF